MGNSAHMRRATVFVVAVWLCFVSSRDVPAQQQNLGSVIGQMHVVRGDTPPERILVSLEVRGAPMDSIYTDSSGNFGFHNLSPNPYYVLVNDDRYEPVRRQIVIDATMQSPVVFVDITLVPKKQSTSEATATQPPTGSNLNMIDAREYSARFPKPAVKEFEKGLQDDAANKRDDAIRHYQKAVTVAPDFFLAHNNLGSDYLSKSDFAAARKEFERVVQLNQSDATAYFNLSNVCMLSGQLPEAQQFLDEGLRRQPESALGQFLLGSLNLRLKRLPQAEVALTKAIQIDPMMAQARLQLINLLLQQGRKQDVVSQLKIFLSVFPDGSYSAQAKQVLDRLEASAKPAVVPN